jgi:hypothetical protein
VQNSVTGHGAELWVTDFPDKTTTPDTTTATHAMTVTALLDFNINHHQPRPGANYKLSNWNCTNDPSNIACGAQCPGEGGAAGSDPACNYSSGLGGTLSDAAPYYGGVASGDDNLLEWMSTASWIDTGNKRGIVQFGVLIDTVPGHTYGSVDQIDHLWYGPNPDFYGQFDPTYAGTGPATETLSLSYQIWDPNDLVAVYNGSVTPYSPTPASTGLMADLPNAAGGGFPAGVNGSGYDQRYVFGQSQYDATTGKLFISLKNVNNVGGSPFPRIYVFQVNQGAAPAPLWPLVLPCLGLVLLTMKGRRDVLQP